MKRLPESKIPRDAQAPDPVVVAVMGACANTKARFIKNVTDGQANANYKIDHMGTSAYTFKHGSSHVTLLEAPNFEEEFLTETEVFITIATWFETIYRFHVRLSAIIYLHPITERRLARYATSMLFRKLCGAEFMRRVVLATTHWDLIKEKYFEVAEGRERRLHEADNWGTLVGLGATMSRFDGTMQGGLRLLDTALEESNGSGGGMVLKIQRELINEQKPLRNTDAGIFIVGRLRTAQKTLESDVKILTRELEEAKSLQRFEDFHGRSKDRAQSDFQGNIVNGIRMTLLGVRLDLRSAVVGLEMLGIVQNVVQPPPKPKAPPTPSPSPKKDNLSRLRGLRKATSLLFMPGMRKGITA